MTELHPSANTNESSINILHPTSANQSRFELGIYDFAGLMPDPTTGKAVTPAQRLRDLVSAIELADQVGLDVFGVGEHHRPDYAASAPVLILSAAAARTQHIKLTTAVTVLSSDDPVRVFQNFATLDLLSNGRAEIMAGRGSFIESFPLFGYDLNEYNELFAEKLDLLLKIRASEKVTWSGQHRAAINNLGVYPRPYQTEIPIWVAVGGTPESVVRCGELGLPMALAIIGGMPEQFAPHVNLYRQVWREAGHDLSKLRLSINSHGFIADKSRQAADESYPSFAAVMNKIGRERGWSGFSRQQFEASRALRGANFIGTPEEIAEKIVFQHKIFKHHRMLLYLNVGAIEHSKYLHAIELLGTKVAPLVRRELGT